MYIGKDDSSDHINLGIAVGVPVTVIITALIILLLIVFWCKRRNRLQSTYVEVKEVLHTYVHM